MQYWLGKKHRLVNRFLSIVTDKVVCVSKSVFDFSMANDRLKKAKYVLVMNGINMNEFIPNPNMYKDYRRQLGINDDDFLIGHVGSFSIRKGQPFLVKAVIELLPYHKNVKLIMVGGYRSHEPQVYEEVTRLIKESKAENAIRILNTREDISNFYNALDLFVMPSTVEGFGLSLAEAMACEKIVIASDLPPFKEIIEENKNGFFFCSKDHRSLAKVIGYVYTHYDELKQVAYNARIRILDHFSNRNMVGIYDRLYSLSAV
jgi:glycosyltransferase involved in cell wall biosynthesis